MIIGPDPDREYPADGIVLGEPNHSPVDGILLAGPAPHSGKAWVKGHMSEGHMVKGHWRVLHVPEPPSNWAKFSDHRVRVSPDGPDKRRVHYKEGTSRKKFLTVTQHHEGDYSHTVEGSDVGKWGWHKSGELHPLDGTAKVFDNPRDSARHEAAKAISLAHSGWHRDERADHADDEMAAHTAATPKHWDRGTGRDVNEVSPPRTPSGRSIKDEYPAREWAKPGSRKAKKLLKKAQKKSNLSDPTDDGIYFGPPR